MPCDSGRVPVSPLLPSGGGALSPALAGRGLVTTGRLVGTVVSAALRAGAAAIALLLLCGGAALLLWSVTPDAGPDSVEMLRGSVAALASAHFLPVSVGAVPITLRPLMLTAIAVAMIATSAGRGRPVRGRLLEALHGFVFALCYAVFLDVVVALAAPPGTVEPGLAAPLCVAAVGVLAALALHRTAWNRWWRRAAPIWVQAGLRGGLAAAGLLGAAGALALAAGLVAGLSDAAAIARLAGDSLGAGFGQLLLGLAFLPNAAVAGAGYLTGAGFAVGNSMYSPFAVASADLPAVPLLAAVPNGAGSSAMLLAFAAQIAAAAVAAVTVLRALAVRRDRLLASLLAALGSGLALAGLAAAARGGVAGGPWQSTGVPVLLAGGLTAGIVLLVSAAVCGAAGGRRVPWVAAASAAQGKADGGGIGADAGMRAADTGADPGADAAVDAGADTGADAGAADTGVDAAGAAAAPVGSAAGCSGRAADPPIAGADDATPFEPDPSGPHRKDPACDGEAFPGAGLPGGAGADGAGADGDDADHDGDPDGDAATGEAGGRLPAAG